MGYYSGKYSSPELIWNNKIVPNRGIVYFIFRLSHMNNDSLETEIIILCDSL